MGNSYKLISDIVKADIDKVNNNLEVKLDLNKELSKELEKYILEPSKRIRSLVTILYLRASKQYLLPEHYELLSAVELVHNASLIHDDVIDESKLRRGRKTLNDKFDNNLAVVSGDYLLGVALKKLVKIGNAGILDIFADTIKIMCAGEVSQYFNKFKKISLDSYIEKTTQKTSSLFEAALKSAMILADAEYDDKTAEFITNFGIAFQIKDDLSGVLNNDKTKTSNDYDNGVYTAPYILSEDKGEGIEKTKHLLNNYINCARQCIEDLEESQYKKVLIELLELMGDV